MALLTVIDVLMMVVGGVGIIYQAICVIMSLFSKPVHFPDASTRCTTRPIRAS